MTVGVLCLIINYLNYKLRGWCSGLSGRHFALYCTECREIKSRMRQPHESGCSMRPFYVFTDPRDTGYIPNVDVVTVISKKHCNYKIGEFYND